MSIQNDLLKEVLEKSRKAVSTQGDGCEGGGAPRGHTCYETENGRVILQAEPI